MASNIWLNSDTDKDISTTFGKLDAQYYHQQYGEDDGSYRTKESEDEIMELVTAYAATVGREARKDELHLLVKEHADICGAVIGKPSRDDCTLPQQLINRLAALQGAQEEADAKD